MDQNHRQLLALNKFGEHITAADDQHAILELAARAPLELTGAQASTVLTFDDDKDRLKLDIAWGLSDNYLNALRYRIDKGLSSSRCQMCNSLKTHLGSDCPLFDGLEPVARNDGIQSLICMPVNHEDERIGIISAYFPSDEGPPEDHIRLLRILGGVIATAIENIRSREREIETLYAIDQVADYSHKDENRAVGEMAQKVLEITVVGWGAQYGGLFLLDEHDLKWTLIAKIGFDETHQVFQLAKDAVQMSYEIQDLVIKTNLTQSGNQDIGSMAAVPLITEGLTLGALFIGAKRLRAINENHTEIIRTVGHQIALAIRNTQLYFQLEQMVVLQERHRLSREFHDGLAQNLGYINLQSERIDNLIKLGNLSEAESEMHQLRETIQDAYDDVREAIDDLRLSGEDPGFVTGQLSDYLTAFSRQTGIRTIFSPAPNEIYVEPSTALQIYRIAQEALTNVRKHAQAQKVEVFLKEDQDTLQLIISDNGIGFPVEIQDGQFLHSYGLTTMRERSEGLGGTITIATSPNEGTHITVNIPVKI